MSESMFFKKIVSSDIDDCVYLALSVALDKPTEEIEKELLRYGDSPKSETQWGRYLVDNGFHRVDIPPIPNKPRIYIEKLAQIALPNQILVCKEAEHVVTIKNRRFYDSSSERSNFCVFWYYTK